jgi:coproporphyrinogen III oxidase
MTTSRAGRMEAFVHELQDDICSTLEDEGTARFREDEWEREEGGGGRSRVLEGGDLFEKAGVNVSAVHGPLPERMAAALDVDPAPFFATGLSVVVHPRNPHVPTAHANFRYFALGEDRARPADEWYGGGADLTPYYPRLSDVKHFHRVWKDVCDRHAEVAGYADFKRECDEYFYLDHREEARGVGGIFYDYLRGDAEATLRFSQDAGCSFLDAYLPIVRRRRGEDYGERERRYQQWRRGRYVEFNLLYDRGTRFGLETGGRTESILMSLPPRVRWPYAPQPEPGSAEERAQWFFDEPRDWLALSAEEAP